jgi:hypothetical protein
MEGNLIYTSYLYCYTGRVEQAAKVGEFLQTHVVPRSILKQ